LARMWQLERRYCSDAAVSRPRCATGLVLLLRNSDGSGCLRIGILCVPRTHIYREEFLRGPQAFSRSKFRGRGAFHFRHRDNLSGVPGVDDAVSANTDGLSRRDGGARYGASRSWDYCLPISLPPPPLSHSPPIRSLVRT